MHWYLMVWRKYAEFAGRSRRKEYWMFVLFNSLAIIALAAIGGAGIAMSEDYGGLLFIPFGIYLLAAFIPTLAVSVRRLHDSGKSGWLILVFFLVGFIPFVGLVASIVQIVIMCQDSDPGTNQYGPNPKFPELAGAAGYAGFTSMGLGLGAQPQMQPPAVEGNFGFCRSCGIRLKDASPFCGTCGGRV
ncbi:MAG: DUF805 domain-containing protein [Candidatus Acidiferrales bacterium]